MNDNKEKSQLIERGEKQAVIVLPSVGYLFRQTWKRYTKHAGSFIGIMAVSVVFTFSLQFLVARHVTIQQWFVGILHSAPFIGHIIFPLLLVFLFVLQFVSIWWGQSASIILVRDAADNVGLKEALAKGWKILPAYSVVIFLRSFFLFSGFSLFLIPGIIFSFWFAFAPYILLVDNVKGMNALLKSREYVRGQFWGISGRVLAVILPTLVIIVPVQIYLSVHGNQLGVQVLGSLITLFVSPFFLVYFFELFQVLKKNKGQIVVSTNANTKAKYIGTGCCGCLLPLLLMVLFAVVSATLQLRSPANALSREQVADIKHIQADLRVYYGSQEEYPDSLAQLSTIVTSTPFDPSTNQPYLYYVEAQKQDYKICGVVRITGKEVCTVVDSLEYE